jgi:hypothetical protein
VGNRVVEEEIDVKGLQQVVVHGRLPRGRWEEVVREEVDPRITSDGQAESNMVAYAPLGHSLVANSLRRNRENRVWEARRGSLLEESSLGRIRSKKLSSARTNSRTESTYHGGRRAGERDPNGV